MNNILVIVDMQNDFVTGALGTAEAKAIVPYIQERIRIAREHNDQIIFTRDSHGGDYMNSREGYNLPVPHCIMGTPGHDIIPELAEMIDMEADLVINKPTFGSNVLRHEIHFLNEALDRDITEIEFIGVCTGICVIANAVLLKTDFYEQTLISVDAKGCACVTPESHQTALAAMKLLQINIKE